MFSLLYLACKQIFKAYIGTEKSAFCYISVFFAFILASLFALFWPRNFIKYFVNKKCNFWLKAKISNFAYWLDCIKLFIYVFLNK